jgi:hypothetical protein
MDRSLCCSLDVKYSLASCASMLTAAVGDVPLGCSTVLVWRHAASWLNRGTYTLSLQSVCPGVVAAVVTIKGW